MTKLLAVTTGLTAAIAVLFIVSLVFNILIFVKVNKDKKDEPTTKEPEKTTVTKPYVTTPVTEVTTVSRTRLSTKMTTRKSSASTSPRTLRISTTTGPPKTISRTRTTTQLWTTTEPLADNNTLLCPRYGISKNTPEYENAAALLLSGLDENVDPCEDFYAFTCNRYVREHNPEDLDVSTISTAKELQEEVDAEIAATLSTVDVKDQQRSETERITKALLQSCVYHSTSRTPIDNTLDFLIEIKNLFGGIPFINHTLPSGFDIFAAMGSLEQNHAMGSLMGAIVSVDYKHVGQHALYISQPMLPMPRDYYILPKFTTRLSGRQEAIFNVMYKLAYHILDDHEIYTKIIQEAAQNVADLERQIAMASWPDTQMRNFAQQYNAFNIAELKEAYPSIKWETYLDKLLSTVGNVDFTGANKKLIITQPSYFGWLNALFSGNFDQKTIVNYMITQLIFEDADFLGGIFNEVAQSVDYVPYAMRRGKGVARVGQQLTRTKNSATDPNLPCITLMTSYMPYGTGYVYVKAKKAEERNEVKKDVSAQTELVLKSFVEMISEMKSTTTKTKTHAKEKANGMVKNYGWPEELFGDFRSSATIDAYHKSDYSEIITLFQQNGTHNYYRIRNVMIKGYSNRESLRLLKEAPKRNNFLMSPAFVNAWYIPERNSITFPYASFNPPFYNLKHPQAYNYAGQHAIAGHEIVHGFDDEGVQFGADGSLSSCTWNECGWMDRKSKEAFRDMAQCVITQYSTQCCPEKSGMIQCANGVTTQGENIADLGGLQAAYRAYQQYKKKLPREETRLPGLERFSPNQLFWITYGFGWCRTQTEENLVNQLLTNPHSPSICRVNQVVQDIPAFGKDFGCSLGQNMYPAPEQRCSVWVED